MKLNADNYRINVPFVKSLTQDLTIEKRLTYVSNVAVATGVPIIVICCYVGELYGFSNELIDLISSLMKFYVVDEVLNVKLSENFLMDKSSSSFTINNLIKSNI
jgi:hypothetical protein